jgi:membrane protein involved in colicin uptake
MAKAKPAKKKAPKRKKTAARKAAPKKKTALKKKAPAKKASRACLGRCSCGLPCTFNSPHSGACSCAVHAPFA